MLKERITKFEAEVARLSAMLKRPAPRIIYVSKTVPVERLREAYEAGVRSFGENKVQEFLAKRAVLPDDLQWHLIGHLQTNKLKGILKACVGGALPWIHSLNRAELARALENQAGFFGVSAINCLLQVNISGEPSKGGFSAGEAESFLSGLRKDSPLKILGLMTLAPLTEDKTFVRSVFAAARLLRDKLAEQFKHLELRELSMGMSGDYAEALSEGTTLLRIGTAIFGERQSIERTENHG